jgi:hypothetical protein
MRFGAAVALLVSILGLGLAGAARLGWLRSVGTMAR